MTFDTRHQAEAVRHWEQVGQLARRNCNSALMRKESKMAENVTVDYRGKMLERPVRASMGEYALIVVKGKMRLCTGGVVLDDSGVKAAPDSVRTWAESESTKAGFMFAGSPALAALTSTDDAPIKVGRTTWEWVQDGQTVTGNWTSIPRATRAAHDKNAVRVRTDAGVVAMSPEQVADHFADSALKAAPERTRKVAAHKRTRKVAAPPAPDALAAAIDALAAALEALRTVQQQQQ